MALVVNDRVKETSTTTGTVTFTLDGAVTGFETFSSAIGNGNTTYYAIEIPNSTEFEVGLGTVSAGQLARTQVFSSSNSDALVDFSAGTKNVFCTLPASKAVIEDASNNVTLPADLTVGTDTFDVDSTNEKVSIGTTSGAYPGLNVYKKSGPGNIYVHLNGNPGTIIGTSLLNEGTSGDFIINTRDNADIRIYTNNTLRSEFKNNGNFYVDTDTLYVDAVNDRVGIGTTSPARDTLHVHSTVAPGTYVHLTNSSTGSAASDGSSIFVDTSGNFEINNRESASIRFKTGSLVAQTITTSETVINEDGASVDFRVEGDNDANLFFVDGSTDRIGIGTSSPGTALHMRIDGGDANLLLERSTAGVTSKWGIKPYNNKLHFRDESVNPIVDNFTMTSDGYFGIGTTSPSSLLHLSSSDPQITITDTDGTGSQIIKAVTDDLTLDAVSSINLDADSGVITFKDGGTQFGSITKSGNDLRLVSSLSDGDLVFRGNDGGVGITALTLDMSEAGNATFNGDVTVENYLRIDNSGSEVLNIRGETTYGTLSVGNRTLNLLGNVIKLEDDTFVERMRMHSNGNIGIGTTSPSSLLHLSSSDPQITITDTDGSGSQVIKAVGDDLEFDVVGKTVIDSDSGGTLQLLDGGTSYLKFFEFGNYAALESMISDNDFKIRGNDGGAFFDALTLDMSEAGDAIFNSNIFLGDNKKANFGADSDLQIYHDGSQSIIEDVGTGQLKILAENTLYFGSTTGNEKYIRALKNGIVELSYDNSAKLTTSSTGIDVTGTAVTDGLTVAGNVSVDGGTIKLDGNYPTGTNNVALGDTAFDSVTTGADNTVIGSGAGTAVTTGQQNTVVGSTALNTGNATGNTAIGFRALRAITGANNVGIGRSAGHDASGGQNTFVGGSAGYYINGTNNVAVGYQAGNGFGTTGSSNIFMGYRAGDNITNGSNNIIIGTSADASSATASNEITLGDANITSLRIPGLQSGASSGDVLTYDGTDITLSAPTGVTAGFVIAMSIAL